MFKFSSGFSSPYAVSLIVSKLSLKLGVSGYRSISPSSSHDTVELSRSELSCAFDDIREFGHSRVDLFTTNYSSPISGLMAWKDDTFQHQ